MPEAQDLLAESESVLGQLSRVQQTMRSLGDGNSGSLYIAAMPGPVSMLFPRFVAEQIGGSGAITVSMMACSSAQILKLARAQSIDFGFANAPSETEPQSLYSAEIITADCLLARPKADPLAQEAAVSLDRLGGAPIGSLQITHAHQQDLLALFQVRDLTFSCMVENQTSLPILQFVAAGQCCAILDPLTAVHVEAAGRSGDSIAIRPLAEKVRGRYADFAPRYRPVSVLAQTMRQAWMREVTALLDGIGAPPRPDPGDQGGTLSARPRQRKRRLCRPNCPRIGNRIHSLGSRICCDQVELPRRALQYCGQ